MAKAKKAAGVFHPPATVRVSVNRNGAEIEADVEWEHAPAVLKALLDVFRGVTKDYPELIQELQPVGGGAIGYAEDAYWEDRRRKKIGFK